MVGPGNFPLMAMTCNVMKKTKLNNIAIKPQKKSNINARTQHIAHLVIGKTLKAQVLKRKGSTFSRSGAKSGNFMETKGNPLLIFEN